jgi:hypothetical protein
MSQPQPKGPPYASQDAQLGGLPTTGVDVPISAVLIALFIGSAALNMTILQLNLRRGHKFVLSGVLFGFSMARITANIMRIVWACYPHNVRIALATSILTNAGVLLLFVANLIFAQRILRAYHPHVGWGTPVRVAFRFLYACVAACLVMVIVAIVYSSYTLDAHIKSQLRAVQLTASTYMAVLAFLPIPIVLATVLSPRKGSIEKFGQGRMRTKVGLVLFTATLLAFGAAFRAGIAFMKRPITEPAWFHSKALFYCINFLIELIVVYTYALSRFDRLFHVPDGSSAPGHYSGSSTTNEKGNVATDEEFLPETSPPKDADLERQQEQNWEARTQSELEKRAV